MLTVESVDLCDLPGLVVASQERDPIRPFCLQRQQPRQGLEAVVSPVYEVAQKYVVGIRHLKSVYKNVYKRTRTFCPGGVFINLK